MPAENYGIPQYRGLARYRRHVGDYYIHHEATAGGASPLG